MVPDADPIIHLPGYDKDNIFTTNKVERSLRKSPDDFVQLSA